MAKFLLLMKGLASQPSATDEQTQAYNRKWLEWIGSLARDGKLEAGRPLEATAKEVTKDAIEDRPLATKDVYGFLVVNAGSLEEVVDLVREAPHTAIGGATIIRPCIDVPMG